MSEKLVDFSIAYLAKEVCLTSYISYQLTLFIVIDYGPHFHIMCILNF